jgi:hypothetical protein
MDTVPDVWDLTGYPHDLASMIYYGVGDVHGVIRGVLLPLAGQCVIYAFLQAVCCSYFL